MLTVPEALSAEPAGSFPSDPFGLPKVHAAPDGPPCDAGRRDRMVLPWVLLAPAMLALGLPLWAGYGVLWAGLGVGLGAVCLLVGQRGRWSMPARVGGSLSLAILGHGLTLAVPLLQMHGYPVFPGAIAGTPTQPQAPTIAPSLHRGGSAMIGSLSPRSLGQMPPSRGPMSGSLLGPPKPELRFEAHIGDLLAAVFATDKAGKGSVFTTTAAGSLKQFSYPDFQPRATYRLEQPAYRAVLDDRRGLLWVAASEPGALRASRHGDRPSGRGNLHVYDIRALSGDPRTETPLHPRRVLPLRGDVAELLAAPDGRALFYLARTDCGVHLGRIDADKEELEAKLPLPAETRALCLTPDGKTLYAAGGETLSAIDSATLRPRRRLTVDGDIWSVAADNEGRVYVGRQGQWTDVTLLDLSGPQSSVKKWSPTLHGRIYLKLAPDQYRLYASSSSVISNVLEALLVRGHDRPAPTQIGVALPDSRGPVGGEFFLAPDGQFLVSCRGKVFHLAPGASPLADGFLQSIPPQISRLRSGGPPPPTTR
jgi:hypothetical protein